LDIDPAYETALFDIAAAYKNWAAADQKKGIKDEPKKDPKKDSKNNQKTDQKPDVIRPKLEKSTEYFEKVIAINKKEYNSYVNLMENYEILGRPEKNKEALAGLEALKNTDVAKESGYWDALGKVYVRINRPSESAEAFKKADQLRGK
jgi:tetratricopeptide (TPR) repeat protein